MQQISNTISITSSLTSAEVQQKLGNRVLIRIPNKEMLTAQPTEGIDNELKKYVDQNRLIVFVDDTGQLYVDGIFYGISEATVQSLINSAVSNFATNVAEEILNHETSIVLQDTPHLLIEQTKTAYTDPDTGVVTYVSPKEYTFTLRDVASQTAFHNLVTYTTSYTDPETGETTETEHTITNLKTALDEAARTAVAEVVDEAPQAFDTLREIAEWINQTGEAAAEVGSLLSTVSKHTAQLNELENFTGVHYTYNSSTGAYESTSDWPYTKTVEDPETHVETTVPMTLTEIVNNYVLGYGTVNNTPTLLADDEFYDASYNPSGAVPYQTITDLNIALSQTAYELRGVISKTVEDGAQKNKLETLENTDGYITITKGEEGTAYETTDTVNLNLANMATYIDYRINERLAWSLLTQEAEPEPEP